MGDRRESVTPVPIFYFLAYPVREHIISLIVKNVT